MFRSLLMIIILISVLSEFQFIIAQCIPSPSESCEEANSFCSLDEMNGYTCNNPSTVQGLCRPLCASCCPPSNYRTWWAFTSQGGNASITISVGACTNCTGCNGGLVLGIWGDCNCNEEITCVPGCIPTGQSKTFKINLTPCKKYYLSIDECCKCICDFTLSTSGGGPPILSPIGFINNISSKIIEPVCIGACDYKFSVNPQQGSCADANYIWTLDGVELPEDKNEIKLDFPNEGNFVLCATAYLGNPKNGSVCSQEGPRCATIKVRPFPDRIGIPRAICFETASQGYRWHSQFINASGIYHEQFTIPGCCKYDSVVEFIILPQTQPIDVLYLNCDNIPFMDLLGFKYPFCIDHEFINLPKATNTYKCDSAITLTSINIGLTPNWSAQCLGAKVELSPNLNIIDTCSIRTTHKLNYNWFKRMDTTKVVIGTNERLIVDTVNEDYCLDVELKVYLGSDSAICMKSLCENIDETKSGAINVTKIMNFCDFAIIDGSSYTQSTTLIHNYKSVFGCDSVVNIEININKSTQFSNNIIGCDSLKVNGKQFYQSAKDTQFLQSILGCDSTIITDLIITRNSSSMMSLKGCDSLVINNQVYYQSGHYTQRLKNTDNCDSLLNLNLTIGKSTTVDFNMSSCDSLVINGKVYSQTGIYSEFYQSVDDCDSIVNLNLIIYKSEKDSLFLSDCDTVIYKGKINTVSGDYPEFYTNIHGCDSIVHVHINITSSNKGQLNEANCDSTTINKVYYDQTGIYTQKLKSANGCDSTLIISLTIGHNSFSNYSYTNCDSAILNSQWFYSSGNYTQTIKNTFQCDSTIDINLIINKSTSGDTIYKSCDSLTINGITYRQTGIYEQMLTNSLHCDSVLIIDFTRLSASSTYLQYKACNLIEINKIVYKQTGFYTQKLTNINQCDSLLNLDIIVNKGTSADSTAQGCDSLIFNGQVYHQSGDYSQMLTNADLCDSTLDLHLSIYNSNVTVNALKTCDSVFKFGKWFYQSGNYPQYLKDIHLCDSTVNFQLTINTSTTSTISQSACDSIVINGKTYFTTGNYIQYLTNTMGCDSILIFDLTIKQGNPSFLYAGNDTSICEGDLIKLNGTFTGQAIFNWFSSNGYFDNPNSLITSFYSNSIGFDKIYLQAKDNCKQWVDSLNIEILPKLIVQITGDTLVNPCEQTEFLASGGTRYTWAPSSYVECLDPPCSRVLLKSNSVNQFTITTDGPCAVLANLNISIAAVKSDIYIPNAFSPNDDNINDTFLPIFNCEQIDFYNFQVFDRWGNLLFESQQKDKGWNGKYKNENLNPGVYPYFIQYQIHGSEKKVKAGEITLFR